MAGVGQLTVSERKSILSMLRSLRNIVQFASLCLVIIGKMNEKRSVWPLICPLCQAGLAAADAQLRCPGGHTFDISREGYVNLLVQRKKTAVTVGDSAEMLRARRLFLEAGHYEPLVDALKSVVAAQSTAAENQVIVEAGCGEGYYLRQLGQPETVPTTCYFGVDIAKKGVQMAARRMKHGRFVVADINKQLPFATQSVHLLLNIFAPRHPAEFCRILAPTGRLLVIIPAPSHLQSVRDNFQLLTIEPEKKRKIQRQFVDQLTLAASRTCTFDCVLTGDQLHALIQMTPNARHLTAEQQAAIAAADHFTTTASFEILEFVRA